MSAALRPRPQKIGRDALRDTILSRARAPVTPPSMRMIHTVVHDLGANTCVRALHRDIRGGKVRYMCVWAYLLRMFSTSYCGELVAQLIIKPVPLPMSQRQHQGQKRYWHRRVHHNSILVDQVGLIEDDFV